MSAHRSLARLLRPSCAAVSARTLRAAQAWASTSQPERAYTGARAPALNRLAPSRHARPCAPARRAYATKSTVDERLEHIQDQYATARDEFEIAHEETTKMSVYAADDRAAARAELETLEAMVAAAVGDAEDGAEVAARIGPRVRELAAAVAAMEELAQSQA